MWSSFTSTCTHTTIGADGKVAEAGSGTFQDCLAKMYQRIRKGSGNRHPFLESLMRDHVGKCICVKRLSANDAAKTCYSAPGQGSHGQGIEYGRTWCEFDNVPTWRDQVKPLAAASGKLASVNLPPCVD